ncbi:branched-chain amino acid ABC transporter permease [Desulfosporosinus fructosivorans]|uniref:Branched-chain amino acid ABC transporter permease n=1 Tax=Desulfosporosinus fructosivorans TaxID=2018669 RepID=A0A4Z0R7B0_9FIRM|nr:branched-chain amino acid ABC transporter permease [Desulfosporosinus fructosivorans]TGE38434.1 branched-chain amino acid ABC transporter permease [Desulfosporosinus fructosivorans]
MDFATIASQFLIGLSRGMIFFIVSAGLTLIFGVLRITNFAHGALYMLGAFIAYSVSTLFGQGPYGFWLALLVAPIAVMLVSLVIERGLLRFIYNRDHLIQMLLTYSLVLIAGDLVKIIWGTEYKSMDIPGVLRGSFNLWGASLPWYNAFLLIIGPVVAFGLWLFLSKTHLGKICRATATDREMVDVLGINSTRVFAMVFALGGWLAGLGGALIAPTTTISMGMDASIIIYAFLIVVIGGLGNIWGALISSIIMGVGEAFGILFIPGIAIIIPYMIAGVLLIVRPSGLLKSAW